MKADNSAPLAHKSNSGCGPSLRPAGGLVSKAGVKPVYLAICLEFTERGIVASEPIAVAH